MSNPVIVNPAAGTFPSPFYRLRLQIRSWYPFYVIEFPAQWRWRKYMTTRTPPLMITFIFIGYEGERIRFQLGIVMVLGIFVFKIGFILDWSVTESIGIKIFPWSTGRGRFWFCTGWRVVSVCSSFIPSMYLLTLIIIPNAILVNKTDVPPILTNGIVSPVTGTRFTETAILANACTTKLRINPMASMAPKALGLFITIRKL